MEVRQHIVVSIHDASHVGDARRCAVQLARDGGFDDERAGKVAIVVNEASSNLLKHSEGGELLLCLYGEDSDVSRLEMLVLDRGSGMDTAKSLQDGFSTAGTPGTGLGAIARISDRFDIHSSSRGSVIFSAVSKVAEKRPRSSPIAVAGVAVSKRGEEECGDTWGVACSNATTRVVVADGLGHGPDAARASREAVRVFHARPASPLVEVVAEIHAALRATRGAAVAVAEMDLRSDTVRYSGLGNISGTIVAPEGVRKLVSHGGTAGYTMTSVREYTYPFPPEAILVLHSDGLKSQWNLADYPGLVLKHPALVAGVLYRDFCRGNDDTAVVVCSRRAA